MIHSDIDGIASAWRYVSFIFSFQKLLEPLSFLLTQFVLLPSCFVFCHCYAYFEFLGKAANDFYFFSLSESNISAFFILRFRIVSKKMIMKWMVVLLLFLFGFYNQIVVPTSSWTNILLSVMLLFSWNHRASLGLNTSFFLALIFFLLHLWSCTYLHSFLDRSYSNPCFFLQFLFGFDNDRRLNFWAPLSNQNIRIIRSIYSIKDAMEQL